MTKRVNASYSAEALRAGVQGAVAVDVTIDPLGKVSDAKVVRSIPLLDAAALAAARQWEFAPTLIDGKPVPIIATIELTFSLAPPPAPTTADRAVLRCRRRRPARARSTRTSRRPCNTCSAGNTTMR